MAEEAISKGEFWFLDSVIIWPFPVFFLLDEDAVGMDLNRPSHGLSREEVIETLFSLFERGDLTLPECDSPEIIPTREEIAEELDAGKVEFEAMRRAKRKTYSPDAGFGGFHYQLTAQGGARWEKAARADWTLFHINRMPPSERPLREWLEIEASTVEVVQQIVIDTWLRNLDIETQVWEVREPWHATYWKTLPLGYYFGCDYNPSPTRWPEPALKQRDPAAKSLDRRRGSLLSRIWYHDPWWVPPRLRQSPGQGSGAR